MRNLTEAQRKHKNEYMRNRYHMNPEKYKISPSARTRKNKRQAYKRHRRDSWLLSQQVARYGLTAEMFYEMLERQGGVCAICGKPETKTRKNSEYVDRLSVEHDHRTNAVRGLVCCRCNSIMGFVDDDMNLLLRVVEYLRKHQLEPCPVVRRRITTLQTERYEL